MNSEKLNIFKAKSGKTVVQHNGDRFFLEDIKGLYPQRGYGGHVFVKLDASGSGRSLNTNEQELATLMAAFDALHAPVAPTKPTATQLILVLRTVSLRA